ncbi:S1 family peptidase [Planctomycetes bacterium K23_9]|uniref:Uncharacterized protein n=1 Tax=Stieleria marina TaxID=1930275 RepID=A0A517NW53_9BACT|nr:hypothetical protein K239x_33210 [Planctomycetes bacterium K23_9]
MTDEIFRRVCGCIFGVLYGGSRDCSRLLATAREWQAKGGQKVQGQMIDQTADTVSLQIPGRNAPVVVKLEHLVEADQAIVKGAWFDRRDAYQYSMVVENLRSLQERPKTVVGLLLKIHNAVPESPYAGLWASVALSQGSNEYSRAEVVLRDVIRRIEKQQAFDPSRHTMTFASASNNMSVCVLKDRRGDAAAARMVAAINARPQIPSVIRHNAQLLNELTTEASFINFSSSTRSRLLEALALGDSAGAGTKLPAGWHYSLDFDVPRDSAGAEKEEGIDAPRAELQLLAQGSGFVVAPGIVLTSRRVVETTNYRGPKLVTVLTNPTDRVWKGEIVDGITIQATRTVASSGRVTTGRFGNIPTGEVYTNYDYVRSPDGHSGAELAALRVPNLGIKPVAVTKESPSRNTPIKICGFGRSKNAVRQGLHFEEGVVLDSTLVARGVSLDGLIDSSRVSFTSARVLGGNRGGPIVNAQNQLVGIAFSTPTGGDKAKGLFFGASELRNWFYKNNQTASVLDPDTDATPEERHATLVNATIPVFCWGLRQPSNSSVFSKVADGSRSSGTVYVRDNWCIACKGRGFIDCPVKGCKDGTVTVRVPTKLAKLRNGKTVMGRLPTPKKCDHCRGKGGQICPHCKDGRLK